MSTDKLWTVISGIEYQLNILKDKLKKLDEETKQSVDEAYHRGYDKGYADKTNNDEVSNKLAKDIYQRGLDDAWECARELYLNGACKDLFGEYFNTFIKNHTAQEAIEKLKAYKQDDKIEAGDEVIYNGMIKCIVVRPETNERYASLIASNGNHYSADHRECKKTGRHFDNIPKILAEMRT